MQMARRDWPTCHDGEGIPPRQRYRAVRVRERTTQHTGFSSVATASAPALVQVQRSSSTA